MATYVGNSPEDILKTRRRNYYYTATSSQTTFTGADDNGTVLNVNESDLEVFMNGVLLDQSDYTANTTHIVLSTAAATDDILEIQTFNDYFVDSNLSRFGGNVSGNLNLRDNIKLNFGASDDLQIYHTGSTSYIFEQGTGDLRIRGSEVRIEDGDGSTIALFREDQGAQLRYNGDIKLESTNTGVDVTGTVISDNYQVNGTNNSFPADTGNPQILGTSNGGTFPFNESGSLVYRARLNNTDGRSNHYFYTGSTPLLRQNIKANGDISFYADDGTTQGFFWNASTQRLGIGTSSPSSQLHLSSALPRIYLTDTDTSTTSFLIGDNGWLTFSADTSRIVFNINSSEVMRMLENGNVGIGTSSPAHLLDLLNSGSGDATIQVKSTTAGDPTLLFDSAAANRNAVIKFMDQGSFVGGRIQYVHLDDRMDFQAGSSIGSTMSIKNGSVGIGTTNPGKSLEVAASGGIPGIRLRRTDITNSDVDLLTGGGSTGKDFLIYVNQQERLRIDTNGDIESKANRVKLTDKGVGTASDTYTVLSCTNDIATNESGVWKDVCYIGHSPNFFIHGRTTQNDTDSNGGSARIMIIQGFYGSVNVNNLANHTYSPGSGTVTNLEYRYLNGGAPAGNYRLQVRVTFNSTSLPIRAHTIITGHGFAQISEDN